MVVLRIRKAWRRPNLGASLIVICYFTSTSTLFAGRMILQSLKLIRDSRNDDPTSKLPRKLTKRSCGICRLEFVHIPKTAGTSIESAAALVNISWSVCHFSGSRASMRISQNITNCPDTAETRRKRPAPIHKTPHWHLPPYYFEGESSHYAIFGNPYANATLFTVVRNPYERVVSEYFYICEEISRFEPEANDMNIFLAEVLHRIEDFIPLNASLKIQPRAYYIVAGHFIPQYDFVYDKNHRRVVDHVLHFENLHNEFPALMDQYNLSDVVLAKKSVGRRARYNKRLGVENLTLSNLRLIEKIYQRDFEAFGYASNRSLLHSSV
jgi:hypothetical protein